MKTVRVNWLDIRDGQRCYYTDVSGSTILAEKDVYGCNMLTWGTGKDPALCSRGNAIVVPVKDPEFIFVEVEIK